MSVDRLAGGAAVCLEVWLQNAEQVLLGDSVFKCIIKTLISSG